AVWWQCHRRLLAGGLFVGGGPGKDILSPGGGKPPEFSEVARGNEGGGVYPGLLLGLCPPGERFVVFFPRPGKYFRMLDFPRAGTKATRPLSKQITGFGIAFRVGVGRLRYGSSCGVAQLRQAGSHCLRARSARRPAVRVCRGCVSCSPVGRRRRL